MKHILTGIVVEDWMEARIGRKLCAPCVAIGLESDGRMTGAALFNQWNGPNVHVTVAGEPRAWSRTFLRRLAAYAFEELDCLRVTLTTEKPEVADLCRRLGGQQEGTMRHAFGQGRDGMVFGILRSEWRI